MVLGRPHRDPREHVETGAWYEPRIAQGLIPDKTCLLPGVTADPHRDVVEGAVWNSRVAMDPSVVGRRPHVILHVRGLVVAIEGRAGLGHRTEGFAVESLADDLVPDQPIRLVRGLARRILFDQRSENVRDRLIQSSRLAGVGEIGGVLCDAVGQLVADYVDALGRLGQEFAVAIAKYHAGAVPEGVVVLLPVVDDAVQFHSSVIDRVALVRVPIELARRAEAVIGLVYSRIADGIAALTPD